MPVKRRLPSNQLPLRTSDMFQLMRSRPWLQWKATQCLPMTPLPMRQPRYPYRVFYLQLQQDWTNRWIFVPLPCYYAPFVNFYGILLLRSYSESSQVIPLKSPLTKGDSGGCVFFWAIPVPRFHEGKFRVFSWASLEFLYIKLSR